MANYYVATYGSDSTGAGTLASPWRTIQYGYDQLSAGDTLYARGGTYVEEVDFSKHGTASSPITIRNYPGELPIIDGEAGVDGINEGLPAGSLYTTDPISGKGGKYEGLVDFISAEYNIMDGFKLTRSMGRMVRFFDNAKHNTLRNCEIYDCRVQAILVNWYAADGVEYTTLEDLNVHLAGSFAQYSRSASVLDWGAAFSNHGGFTTIRRCEVHETWTEGIIMGRGSTGGLVEDSVMWNCYALGLYFNHCTDTIARRNHIYHTEDTTFWRGDAPSWGIVLNNEGNWASSTVNENLEIYNNFVRGCNHNLGFWGSDHPHKNITIVNNTFVEGYNGAFSCKTPSGTTMDIQNNVFLQRSGYMTESTGSIVGLDIHHNNWYSLTPQSWAQGAGDQYGDPRLVEGAGYQPSFFNIGSDLSDAVDTGYQAAYIPSDDFYQNLRDASPDMGGHEWLGASGGIRGEASASSFAVGELTLATEVKMPSSSTGTSTAYGALSVSPGRVELAGISQGTSYSVGELSGATGEVPFPSLLDLTVYMDLKDEGDLLEFDGTINTYVKLQQTYWTNGANFTWEMWVRTNSYSGYLLSHYSDLYPDLFEIYQPGNLQINSMGSSHDTGIAINDGAAHHIAVINKGGKIYLYVDSKLRFSESTTSLYPVDFAGSCLVLGQNQGSSGGDFSDSLSGQIWDLRFWESRTRTEDELLDNMNLRLAGNETNLEICWKLDEGSGTVADDLTSNNYDGTIGTALMWATDETKMFTDVTDRIDADNVRWNSVLGQLLDGFSFEVHTWSGQEPTEWDEVVVYDGTDRFFGGFVTSYNKFEGDDADPVYWIGCSDYGAYLERTRVGIEEYDDYTDAEIINDLLERYVPWIGHQIDVNVESVEKYDRIRFFRKNIRAIINELADYAGAHWYVGPDRELYFFSTYNVDAPYDLTDTPNRVTSYPYHGLVVQKGGSRLVNRIDIIGGRYLNEVDQTFHLKGTGEEDRIIMPFQMQGPIAGGPVQVSRNDAYPTTNYINNPSFEVDVSLWDSWNTHQTGVGGAYVQDNTYAKYGTESLKITSGSDGERTDIYTDEVVNPITVEDGQKVLLSAWVWTAVSNKTRLRIYDVTNSVFRKTSELFGGDSEWKLMRVSWTNNTGGTVTIRAYLGIFDNLKAGGIEAWFDGVMLTKDISFIPAFIDGTQEDCLWTGSIHDSPSYRSEFAEPIWTSLTVLTGHIDELTDYDQVLHYFEDKVLETMDPWPILDNACRVFGRNEIPLRTRVRDQSSFNFYEKWFDDLIVDKSIVDKATAKIIGKSKLAEQSTGTTTITVHWRERGIRSGQRVRLVSSKFGIDDYFLVQRVDATIGVNGRPKYAGSLGIWNADLVALLLQIYRDTEPEVEFREDEVLDEVLHQFETLELIETTPAPTTTTPPYLWDDADARWDFAAFLESFEGVSEGTSSASGALTVEFSGFTYLKGNSSGQATTTGSLSLPTIELQGASTGTSTASGTLLENPYFTIATGHESSPGTWKAIIADSTGYLYCVIKDESPEYNLTMWRSADGGETWAEMDGTNRPQHGSSGVIRSIAISDDIHNDRIYIAVVVDKTSSDDVYFHSFITNQASSSKDTWDVTDKLIVSYSDTGDARTVGLAVGDTDNDIIVLSQGALDGTYREARYHYSTNGGSTWTTDQVLDDGSSSHKYSSWAIRGPVTGDIYALWNKNYTDDLYLRYASDVDQSFSGATSIDMADQTMEDVDTWFGYPIVVYQDGSSEKVLAMFITDTANRLRTTLVTDQGTPDSSKQVSAKAVRARNKVPAASLTMHGKIANVVMVDASSHDIWMYQNVDDGSWGSEDEIVNNVDAGGVTSAVVTIDNEQFLAIAFNDVSAAEVRFLKVSLDPYLKGVASGSSSATGILTKTTAPGAVEFAGVSTGTSSATGHLSNSSDFIIETTDSLGRGLYYNGPVQDGNGNLYLVMRDGSSVAIYKSSDGGETWSVQDSANQPSSGTNTESLWVHHEVVDDQLMIAVCDNSYDFWFHSFYVSTDGTNPDKWNITDKLVHNPSSTAGEYAASIARGDSTSDLIMTFSREVQGSNEDAGYAYSTDQGVNWSTDQQLDDGGDSVDHLASNADYGWGSKKVYAGWKDDTGSQTGLYYRTLADVDQAPGTAKDLCDYTMNDRNYHSRMRVFQARGKEHCVAVHPDNTPDYPRATFWTDEGTPDSSAQIVAKAIKRGVGNSHDVCMCLTVDGETVYFVYVQSSDSDIYYITNVNNGGWSGDTELKDAVDAEWVSAGIFDHLGKRYLGVAWDDKTSGDIEFVREYINTPIAGGSSGEATCEGNLTTV